MKKSRYVFSAILILFVAYCTLDAGYSYWTDHVTVSGKAKLTHSIEVNRIIEFDLLDDNSDKEDKDKEDKDKEDKDKENKDKEDKDIMSETLDDIVNLTEEEERIKMKIQNRH